MKRSLCSLLHVALSATVSVGQTPPACLPGLPPTHPLFGAPSVRVDVEELSGASAFAEANHAALADIDGDELPDAVIAVSRDGQPDMSYLSVCHNLGNGLFAAPILYTSGRGSCAVQLDDFNRDGKMDVAVVNSADNSIMVRLNIGQGTFGPPATYPVGVLPRSVAVGDINHDGWVDLAVLNCQTNDVSILLNAGNGEFLPEHRLAVGPVSAVFDTVPGPFLALADFNGDTVPDLVIPSYTQVKVFLNDGTGNFVTPAVTLGTGSDRANCVLAVDLNHDGKTDIAVANTGRRVTVFAGRGDGSFEPAVNYPVDPFSSSFPAGACYIAAGDLDGDGFPELAVGFEEAHGIATILRNRGDGTFGAPEFHYCGDPDWFVSLTDIRQAGRPDLIVLTSATRSSLRTALNDGNGHLLDPLRQPDWTTSYGLAGRVAVADIDQDGFLDVAFGNQYGTPQIRLLRGVGNGQLQQVAGVTYGATGQATCDGLQLADLNGDGRPDLVAADPIVQGGGTASGSLLVILNTGGMTFGTPSRYPLSGVTPSAVVVADLNGDGRPDIAMSSDGLFAGTGVPVARQLQVFINRGDGTFVGPAAYVIGSAPHTFSPPIIAADLDRDGRPELVAGMGGDTDPGQLIILHNHGDGMFEVSGSVPVAPRPYSLAAADINGDGWMDIAVLHGHFSLNADRDRAYLTVLTNDRAGAFVPREYINPNYRTTGELVAADLSGDGKPDLAFSDGMVSVLLGLNRGDGSLDDPVAYGATSAYDGPPWSVAACDLDHDGRVDLIVAPTTIGTVSYLRNVVCSACYANCDGSTSAPILNIADFVCFQQRFAAGDATANCDNSTMPPVLNIADFVCFQQKFAAGCQ